MITIATVEASSADEHQEESRLWGDIAVGFASQLARDDFRRGDLAELRRMDPDKPGPTAFWRLMAQRDLLEYGAVVERKWALIIHGLALMTPAKAEESGGRTAHDSGAPVGRALFLGGESQRITGFYSEMRLNRLLTARGPMLRTLLARMFRMMAAANGSFDWREMARFILNEGHYEAVAEEGRRRIARDYYRAERRSALSAAQSD